MVLAPLYFSEDLPVQHTRQTPYAVCLQAGSPELKVRFTLHEHTYGLLSCKLAAANLSHYTANLCPRSMAQRAASLILAAALVPFHTLSA